MICESLPVQYLKRDLEGVKHVAIIPTCLWKLSSRRALSSMVALVRKSPARDPGRFSSSAMRWVMRACSLTEKSKADVGRPFNNASNNRDDPDLPVLPLLQYLHRVKAAGFLDGGYAVLLGVVRHHGRGLHRLTRRLGLWGHHRGGSRGNRRWGGRRSPSGLRRNQLLWCVGGDCCIHHGALREAA